MIETKAGSGGRSLLVNDTEMLEQEAKIATEFIVKWGCVAATPDGEDSTGRSRLRAMTPEELVERGTATAKLLMEHFRNNGLVHKTPSMKDIDINGRG